MIPKRDKNTDIAKEVQEGRKLKRKIEQLADEVAQKFLKGADINGTIAEISKREKLNQLQIQRLIEEGNTRSNIKKYETLKHKKDRRMDYEIGDLSKVLQKMGGDAPPAIENPNQYRKPDLDTAMKKQAGYAIESFRKPYHPHDNVEDVRAKYLEKTAALQKQVRNKEIAALEKEIQSSLFKIAVSLVETCRHTQDVNELYNSLLTDAEVPVIVAEQIEKKAQEVTTQMKNLRRVPENFMVSLELNPMKKVATSVLGERGVTERKDPKLTPTGDVASYEQLVALARRVTEDVRNLEERSTQ